MQPLRDAALATALVLVLAQGCGESAGAGEEDREGPGGYAGTGGDTAQQDTGGATSSGGETSIPPSTPEWPFDRPSITTLQASPKKVFAHWHWYPMSFDDKPGDEDYFAVNFMTPTGESGAHVAYGGYLRERPLARLGRSGDNWRVEDARFDAELAQRIGIDGFFLNVWDGNAQLTERWMAAFDGAAEVPGFAVAPNFDLSILDDHDDEELSDLIVAFLQSVAEKASLFRLEDGRVVIGMFHAANRTAEFFTELRERLTEELDMTIHLALVFLGTGSAPLFETYAPVSDLLAGWGTAVPTATASASNVAEQAIARGRPWMHPVLAQDFRPYTGSYWEAAGSRTLREGWASVIASDIDWVQVVTWNDHSEHHALRPSTGKQWAYYDLAAYYITWFKTGEPPPIARDALYYFHRIHPVGAIPTAQASLATCRANCPGIDEIELVAFLTEPGTVAIESDGQVTAEEAPAGVSTLRVPLAHGRPVFRLERAGATVIELTSAFDIRDAVSRQDLLYRAGGSLRAGLPEDCTALCTGGDVMGCLECEAEPVWLVSNPPP